MQEFAADGALAQHLRGKARSKAAAAAAAATTTTGGGGGGGGGGGLGEVVWSGAAMSPWRGVVEMFPMRCEIVAIRQVRSGLSRPANCCVFIAPARDLDESMRFRALYNYCSRRGARARRSGGPAPHFSN